ncbi:unnamed protein product [Amaranthus hypochondriacus]
MFLQEERLQIAAKLQNDQQEIHAMAVKSNGSFASQEKICDNGSKTFFLSCTYCQRRGHEEANCWIKHGYPERWDSRSSRGGGRGSGRGSRGFSRNDRRSSGRNDVHNYVSAVSSNEGVTNTSAASQPSLSNITNSQWQKLIELLGNSSLQTNDRLSGEYLTTPWLIDSDASHNVTGPTLEDADWSR